MALVAMQAGYRTRRSTIVAITSSSSKATLLSNSYLNLHLSILAPAKSKPTYLAGINALGDGPGGDDVVQYPLAEVGWHVVQFHKLLDILQHLVVPSSG